MDRLHDFPNILAASQALLRDAVSVVEKTGLDYAVIGGWSPFLLNNGAIMHPGTRDVDILFEDGASPGSLRSIVEAFKESGYIFSAKHDFQVLRVLKVSGVKFIFNVDILHSSQEKKNPNLFADQISFPVKLSDQTEEVFAARSIVVPLSNFIFNGNVVRHKVKSHGLLENDGLKEVEINLMSEVGTFVTKVESMFISKRTRDAFDIMLVFLQPTDKAELISKIDLLKSDCPAAFSELSNLWKLTSEIGLKENIIKYWPAAADPGVWIDAMSKVKAILCEADIWEVVQKASF